MAIEKKEQRRPKRSGSVRQRESGLWQAIVRRKGQPAMSKTFLKKDAAERWIRDCQNQIDQGAFVSPVAAERTLFKDLARDFETDFAPHHYRGAAWKYKLAALGARLGDYALVAITPQVVGKYRDERLKDPDPRYKVRASAPRVSEATVKSELDLLSKVLDVAQKEFGIPIPAGNPVAGVRKPKSARQRDRRLSDEEWGRLEAECAASGNPWLAPALTLAVETAMRQGELLSLEWRHVHVDKDVRVALLLDPEKLKTATPRAVPLTTRAVAVLERLPRSTTGRVIPIDRMTLYKAFERACERAGIRDYRWHDLRHEAISRLAVRPDLTTSELKKVSGHTTLQMLERYTHLEASKLAKKLG